ncbi:hypothetical protein [Streptomyces sp. NPDC049906]|uniref:ABC transporter substrate-binding protein n=1 Tax=Streptomyces sp. NPDC049906 TaxID=3155656 RepID=UPI00341B5F80
MQSSASSRMVNALPRPQYAQREDNMPEHLTVGTFTPSVLLDVARRLGALAEQELTVTEIGVASSPAQFRALLDDDLQVALTSPDNVLSYRFSPSNPLGGRQDVQIVSAVDRGLGLALYGRPGLTDPAELRGAVVGVDVPNSGFALALYETARVHGLPRDALRLAALGSTPRRLTALLAGDCDATLLNAGNELVAEDAGCARLAAVTDVCPGYLGAVLAVAGTRRLAHTRRLARALLDTARRITTGEADAEVTESAGRLLGLTPERSARYLDRLRDPEEGLVTDEDVPESALATLIDLRRRHLPEQADGTDVLATALHPGAGLVAPRE